jgi:proteic killer suppression protein
MIQNFRHKGLKRLFEKGEVKGVRADRVEKIENIIFVISRARKPQDVDLPGVHLHPLTGDMKGLWAVTVRANWRVTFRFEEGEACDVDLVDHY